MSNIVRLAPETPAAIIAETDITLDRLSSFLSAAVIDFRLDTDGDLYVYDGLEFPIWIEIEADRKLLKLFTFSTIDQDDPGDLLARVNEMNSQITAVQFHLAEQRIWGHHWLTYDGGLNVRHFIKMIRCFSSAFACGVSTIDCAGPTVRA